jgi:hypothetical protein
MNVRYKDRLPCSFGAGESVQIGEVQAGIPVRESVIRAGVMMRHESSPGQKLRFASAMSLGPFHFVIRPEGARGIY